MGTTSDFFNVKSYYHVDLVVHQHRPPRIKYKPLIESVQKYQMLPVSSNAKSSIKFRWQFGIKKKPSLHANFQFFIRKQSSQVGQRKCKNGTLNPRKIHQVCRMVPSS